MKRNASRRSSFCWADRVAINYPGKKSNTMKRKWIIAVLAILVCFVMPAIVLGVGQTYFYLVAAIVVIALVVLLFGAAFSTMQNNASAERLKIMDEEHDLPRYLELQRKAALKARSQALKTAEYINLAAGYINNDQLDEAEFILKGLTVEKMNFGALMAYHYNLLFGLCMRENPDLDKIKEAYSDALTAAIPARGEARYNGMLQMIENLVSLRRGDYGAVLRNLEGQGETGSDDLKNLLDWMRAEALRYTGKSQQAVILLEGIFARRPFPVIRRVAKTALEECNV